MEVNTLLLWVFSVIYRTALTTICPDQPFPIVIGAPDGDTMLTYYASNYQSKEEIVLAGKTSAGTFNGGELGVFKPFYVGIQGSDLSYLYQKYLETTGDDIEIIALKYTR